MVTNGSMQAAAFLFELLVQDGDLVVVEAPTYDRTLLSLRNRGARILPIPLEVDGIDVSALEAALLAGARPKLAHIIPTFQNPAGCTLSLAKRAWLVQLAEQYDFVIFEDDPYIELRFEGERLPTMLSLDENDRVVYASSFTKTVCPGVRVGYLAGPAAIISATVKLGTETYISPSMVTESIVNEFCRSGAFDRSILAVTRALRDRLGALVAALIRELPDARFTPPTGGYFLWVCQRRSTSMNCSPLPRIVDWSSSRARVFCSTEGDIRCGWRTPGWAPRRSRRVSAGWPTPIGHWRRVSAGVTAAALPS
jgi:DNA-binding transcriptional MocR family regulator